jgi:putative FmdB family regulatory protein
MPIYEYACEKCESEFEVEQRITDDPVKTCPDCRSRKVKRLISKTSFVLKGGGWYSDLYSSEKGKDAKPTEKPSASESKESGASADSKAEPKEKSKSAGGPKEKSKAKGKGKGKSTKAVA